MTEVSRGGEVVGQLLRQGGHLNIKARGGSMVPFFLDGDVAEVRAAAIDEIHVGDVICYESLPGRLFLHRVVRRRGTGLVAKGDALPFTETVSPAQLLGRVVAVERHGRLRRLDTSMARRIGRVIAAASPLLTRVLPFAIGLWRAWRRTCGR